MKRLTQKKKKKKKRKRKEIQLLVGLPQRPNGGRYCFILIHQFRCGGNHPPFLFFHIVDHPSQLLVR